MQKKCKLLSAVFVFIISSIAFGCISIIWYVDPLKLLHKPFMCKDISYDNVNFSVKGLIDNSDFDSVIVGTSLLSNFSNKESSEVLGGSFFNASIWGTLVHEKADVLNYILKRKNIKKVIISLDQGSHPLADNSFESLSKDVISTYTSFFHILNLYSQDKHLTHIFNFKCEGNKINYDTPTTWTYNKDLMKRIGSFENWARIDIVQVVNINNTLEDAIKKIKSNNLSYEGYAFNKEYLDKNLLYYFKKYPDIEFILIVPPYFIAQNAIYFQTNVEFQKAQKESLLYLTEQKPKNVKIFAFDNIDFASDIRNYYDLVHFSPQISSDILRFIKNNEGLLEKENFEKYWSEFSALAMGFDLEAFYDKFLALAK